MDQRDRLLAGSLFLLGLLLLAASTDHQSYLQLCVCVVNALSRAVISLSCSIFFAVILYVIPQFGTWPAVVRTLVILQGMALSLSLFFIVQYVLLLLEVVS